MRMRFDVVWYDRLAAERRASHCTIHTEIQHGAGETSTSNAMFMEADAAMRRDMTD